jgi:hypothetical protein
MYLIALSIMALSIIYFIETIIIIDVIVTLSIMTVSLLDLTETLSIMMLSIMTHKYHNHTKNNGTQPSGA